MIVNLNALVKIIWYLSFRDALSHTDKCETTYAINLIFIGGKYQDSPVILYVSLHKWFQNIFLQKDYKLTLWGGSKDALAEATAVLWLATRGSKMGLSCKLCGHNIIIHLMSDPEGNR